MRSHHSWLAVAAGMATAFAVAGPVAAKSPQPGTYQATGGTTFTFSLAKSVCPPAKGGKEKRGICLTVLDDPEVELGCDAGAGQAYLDYPDMPYNKRLARNGTLKYTVSGYFADGELAKTTNFWVKVRGKKAVGWVTLETFTPGTTGSCSSGKVEFNAKLK